MSNLIRINDQQLRKKAFAEAAKLLRRLDRLEADVESFHGEDARLYQSWYDLTFRRQKLELEDLREEHRRLARLHNWMIALCEMQDLTPRQAMAILRREEKRYARGTPQERAKIEEARHLRDEFIRASIEREDREAMRDDFDFDDDDDDDYDEDDARADAENERNAARADAQELRAIANMSDDEVRGWCTSSEISFAWLSLCLRNSGSDGDTAPFIRVWDLTSDKNQKQFAKLFRQTYGQSLFEIIETMRAERDLPPPPPPLNGERPPPAGPRTPGEEAERLKLIYRQLVRKLHPDLQGGENSAQSPWQKSIWMRVQQAYGRKDRHELDKLFRFVLLRGKELNDLLLSEIRDSHNWLKQEVARTKANVKDLRRSPAWGFSRRKDFGPIKRKINKEFTVQRMNIEDQIEDLRMRHEDL